MKGTAKLCEIQTLLQLQHHLLPNVSSLIVSYLDRQGFVYMLQSVSNPHRFYVGKTYDLSKRLAQHNGLVSCTVTKSTQANRPWKMVLVITADDVWFNEQRALQLEWALKYYTRKRKLKYKPLPQLSMTQLKQHSSLKNAYERLQSLYFLFHVKQQGLWTSRLEVPKEKPRMKIYLSLSLQKMVSSKIASMFLTARYWPADVCCLDSLLSPQKQLELIEKCRTLQKCRTQDSTHAKRTNEKLLWFKKTFRKRKRRSKSATTKTSKKRKTN